MTFGEKGLRKKANTLELVAWEKNKINSELIPEFEELLQNVYVAFRPKEKDYFNRNDLVRIFNEIAKEIYGNSDVCPVVRPFGSFLMDLFTDKSDLDLSVNLGESAVEYPKEEKVIALKKFMKKFYTLQRKGHVTGVQPILFAKVPILKVIDRGTGVECDLSIENRDGIVKSAIIRHICSIDQRFQMLSFLTKAWASANGINSSKDRTLNSLSIILLVAFHLQTRDPPILPPFAALLKDGPDPSRVEKLITRYKNYGERNKESLAELFVTLLNKLASVEKLWSEGLCASAYDGFWLMKTWEHKRAVMSVEDFTDRSQNVARAVGSGEVKRIYEHIHSSLHSISAFMNGKIEAARLRVHLFGREGDGIRLTSDGKRALEYTDEFNSMVKKLRANGSLEGIMMQPVPFVDVLKKIVSINNDPNVPGQTSAQGWRGPSGNPPATYAGNRNPVSSFSESHQIMSENLRDAPVIPSFVSQIVNGSKSMP